MKVDNKFATRTVTRIDCPAPQVRAQVANRSVNVQCIGNGSQSLLITLTELEAFNLALELLQAARRVGVLG